MSELGNAYPGIVMLVMMSDIFDITLDELIIQDKDLKKPIIETYSVPPNNEINQQMNVWEFLAQYRWLVFPFGFMIILIVTAF